MSGDSGAEEAVVKNLVAKFVAKIRCKKVFAAQDALKLFMVLADCAATDEVRSPIQSAIDIHVGSGAVVETRLVATRHLQRLASQLLS